MKHSRLVIVYFVTLTVIIGSCASVGGGKKNMKHEFEKMKWMIGYWKQQSGEMVFAETWNRESDTLFKAHSITLMGRDTIFYEQIRIEPSDGEIFLWTLYKVDGKSQGFAYKLIRNTGKAVVFENKSVPGQSRIEYHLRSDGSVSLSLAGTDSGEKVLERYMLRKLD